MFIINSVDNIKLYSQPYHTYSVKRFVSVLRKIQLSFFLFHTGNSKDDHPSLVAQEPICSVKESSNPEIEKSCGGEMSENEANLSDTSPSPKDTEVEFVAKNDGSAVVADTTATVSKRSEEGTEEPHESGSDDSDDSEECEMGQKVLWLTFLLHIDESIKFIHELFHSIPNVEKMLCV